MHETQLCRPAAQACWLMPPPCQTLAETCTPDYRGGGVCYSLALGSGTTSGRAYGDLPNCMSDDYGQLPSE